MISVSVRTATSLAVPLAVLLTVSLASSPAPRAASDVTLQLGSPQSGQVLAAGSPVQWLLFGEVDANAGAGLALFAVDLVQDPGNPARIDFPPGDPAPSGMAGFDRPAGFTNPSEDPWGSAYGGRPIGPVGSRNLLQIGGAQNVFGSAPDCFGPAQDVCMGQDVFVDGGIGQSGLTLFATGTFLAPSMPGTYTLRLVNPLANVLVSIATPPAHSPTRKAKVDATFGSFSFAVQ